jgi:hypothetical protein
MKLFAEDLCGSSAGAFGDQTSRSCTDHQGSRKQGEGKLRINCEAPVDGALGSLFTLSHGYGGDSVKTKAA